MSSRIPSQMHPAWIIANWRLGMSRVRSNHDSWKYGHKVRRWSLWTFENFNFNIMTVNKFFILFIWILLSRSRAMRLLSVDQLCTLLKHALNRLRSVSNVDPFTRPVDPTEFPAYKDYVTCPMDLLTIEKNVKRKQ